jgi:3-oxoacyl-[acyl-carrier protein] reductase
MTGTKQMENGELGGKVAVVTGSATGIGAAVAEGLARRGANIVVNYTKSEAEAQETAATVRAAGVDVRVVQGDVAKDEDCRRLANEAMSAWGRIDILVNNAGTTKFVTNHADMDSLSAEDFARIYAVNVIGPFQMIRACLDGLRASKAGSVVNVSSIAGVAGIGSSVAYAASKGALNTMTYSLARALAPEVRVNAVCPGYVDTPWFVKQFGAETAEKIALSEGKRALLQRTADGAEIAKTVLFFAGPESGNITGETLLSDGGIHLSMAGARR